MTQLIHLYNYEDFMPRMMESVDPEAKSTLKAAIALVLINLPFFAPLMIRLWVVEDPSCNTMYTNGKTIGYSPKFVNTLTVGECAWVLVHEIMHNVLLHFTRKKSDPKLWNIAGDYAINLLIRHVSDNAKVNERFKMPEGGLYDEQYLNWSADAIYDYLEKNPEKQPKTFNNFGEVTSETIEIDSDSVVQQGQSGLVDDEADETDEGGGSEGDGQEAGQEGQDGSKTGKTAKADPNAKEQGKVQGKGKEKKPGQNKIVLKPVTANEMNSAVQQGLSKAPTAIRRYYDLLFKSKIDWKKELKKYIQEVFDKIKYKMPYRRFAHAGQYLTGPIKRGEELKNVVIALDTSGSINNEMINEFLTEVAGIIQSYQIENLYVLSIDDVLRTENKFKNPRDLRKLKVDIKGGGGTSFIPAFKWIDQKLHGKFVIFIYITDALGEFPEAPSYANKVIWLVKGPGQVPFGKRISLSEE